ncbi:MAG: FtsK/SpoIIIE domain-containing protein [Acidimicrobiia bacterium]
MTLVRLGRFADGDEMTVRLDQWHTLIAGLSGTGKSSTLRTLLVGAARDPMMALVLVDAKRVELTAWRPRATCVMTEADSISAGLAAVSDLVDDRYRLMEVNGATSWPVTTSTPRILLVVDELAALTAAGDRTRDRANAAALRHILERGRAAGVVVVAAIQRPAADVLPTSVRDLFQLRIVHATANRDSTEMAAGAAWMTSPAHTLPVGPQHGGLCFAVLEGAREGRLARAYWTTPEQAEGLAARTASYRQPWPSALPAAPPVAPRRMPNAQPEGNPTMPTTEPNPGTVPWSPPEPPQRPLSAPVAVLRLDADETAVLDLVRAHGAVPAGTLHLRCRLSEGRARRAAQRLEARSLLVRDGRDWRTC